MRATDCIVCGADALVEIEAFRSLPRVTSDCKPYGAGGRLLACDNCGGIQKSPDARWFEEIGEIYSGYEIYKLSDGEEQLIFTDAGPIPRSQRLVEYVKGAAALPASGRLIDIGCGNGAALARYSKALPQWKLFGSELSDRALAELRSLPNFVDLYTLPIGEIPGEFDIVSMIHSLEHMPSPGETLEQVGRLLAGKGELFVEVPDAETSPFDILVADHLTHFTGQTLGYLASRSGLAVRRISNTVLPKEITMLAAPGGAATPRPDAEFGVKLAAANVQWLADTVDLAKEAAKAGTFGIFGTSISGMWLYGALSDRVSFFVDEDPKRIGRQCAGKPIYSPQDAPRGSTVFVPLAPGIATKVAARHQHQPATFVPGPPAFETASVR